MAILLPDTVCCYSAETQVPDITPPPALRLKTISFGNFDGLRKVNESVLTLWAQVLLAVEGSTLTLAAPEGTRRSEIAEFMHSLGVDRQRVLFSPSPRGPARFGLYQTIDIALDTFPMNGQIASLDAMFMGVPLVTRVGAEGSPPASRSGWSHLLNLQLAELAAFSGEEFVEVAAQLARNLPRLIEIRSMLRTRMIASPLMDSARYSRNVEAAYRTAWQRWCRRQTPKN